MPTDTSKPRFTSPAAAAAAPKAEAATASQAEMNAASTTAAVTGSPASVDIVAPSVATRPAAPSESTPADGDREARIAEAAYYRAEARGFAPGQELEDWLDAEREVDGSGADAPG